MDLGLKGKVAVITGTGSQIGFGKAISLKLAEEGCDVVGVDIDGAGAEKTAAEVKALGRKSLGLKVDITNRVEVDAAVKKIMEEFGKIDILVNNAGMDPGWVPFMELDVNDLKKAMDVNLYGGMNMVQAIAPHMISRKYGKIVNFSGGQGGPNTTSYSASKGAVDSWSEVLAKELVPLGVIVNTFLPPPAKTQLGADHLPPDFADRVGKMMPLGRVCTTEEVGAMIAFMVSDANSYMIGQYLKL
ncbi:MAG: SDR family oxidoreductase [Dehalococcoidales bacterium]|nr:SDR family oxidoreductase [Dehalococcoidales bacterium]